MDVLDHRAVVLTVTVPKDNDHNAYGRLIPITN
jgi:hypothetical protein